MQKNLDSNLDKLVEDMIIKERKDESLKNAMSFPLLSEMKESNLMCDEHMCKLVQVRQLKPFCQQCAKEKIDRDNNQMTKEAVEKHHKRTTYDWLGKLSIVRDGPIKHATFDNYETSEQEPETIANKKTARGIAGQYLQGATYNTVFNGVVGTGKSHLAMSILKAVNENSDPFIKCLFISVDDLMRLIKDSFNNHESPYTEKAMIERLSKADLLVLDDLGAETGAVDTKKGATDWTVKTLSAIVNGRMDKPTIFTTNLSSEDLIDMYDSRLVSRMFRGTKGHIVKFEKTKDKRTVIDYGF